MVELETLRPIRDHIIVVDMHFGERRSSSGIVLSNDDGKTHGIRPRWATIHAVGPEQSTFAVGERVLIEHGRWTRGFETVDASGQKVTIRRCDPDAIMIRSDHYYQDENIGNYSV